MGKLWSPYTPTKWANHAWSLGFRAVVINGVRGTVDNGGGFDNMESENQSDYWLALKKIETDDVVNSISAAIDRAFYPGDPTWKERHAKGVPVKMSLSEWRTCHSKTKFPKNHHPARTEGTGEIIIWVEDWDDFDSDESVQFCNFRYKQSWLEKKGGNYGR
jgi:hypothetical protein